MASDTLKLLEFDNLLALVGNYIASPLGKAKLPSYLPCQDLEIITARQRLAANARDYLRSNISPRGGIAEVGSSEPGARNAAGPSRSGEPVSRTMSVRFSGLSDPEPILQKVAIEGTVLEISEIAALLSFADQATDIKRAIEASERRFPHLAEEAAGIGDFHSLLRELHGKILPSGELDDHASPELKRLRREMEKQRGSILSSLRNFLRTQEEDSQQEEIITIRGERFVVPVRVARKNRVQGIVHGASSSGQTVYVEPLETMDLNNELVRLKEEEQREIHRILLEMTALLRQRAAELSQTGSRIAVLEVAFACGQFALDYDCVIPRVTSTSDVSSQQGRLVLKDARHPLLEALLRRKKVSVMPLSLELEREDRVLVISGPNTGGKTVALKTVGLLALMAMAGLPVPATEAEFPLFDRILADIGDYQSIQESLSTFSAHLLNIASMMASATRDSLILLDELGSATDPEEAGALGVAVVDKFRSAGAFTIASTHHLLVKAYATNTPGVRSASMGFDEQTLQPTYRLEIGVPGKSSGLDIAQRLGLPPDVLDRARQELTSAHLEVERFLVRLRDEESAATQLHGELDQKLAALAQQEREWKESLRRREDQRTAEWNGQLEQLWRSFEERAEQKLREIASRPAAPARRSIDPQKEAARMASRFQQQAQEELRQTAVSHLGESEAASLAPEPISLREPLVGERVRTKDFKQWGIVRRKEQDWLEVEIGHLRTRISLDDVVEVLPVPNALKDASASGKTGAAATASFTVHMEKGIGGSLTEINVIGQNAEEAQSRVDKFLDNAFLAQVARVRVVHGSGKGILRHALAEMFSTHPHVEKFALAPQNEGGAGATIVDLKL